MAFTQADVDHIDRMIAEGVLESETADQKRIKFDSFEKMKARRSYIVKALRGRKSRVGFVTFEGECE